MLGLQPVQLLAELAPEALTEQEHGEVRDPVRLNQRESLEGLVQRPVAAGKDQERARVLDEHQLADEEVPELEAALDVGVGALLLWEADVEPDRQSPTLSAASIRCLHDSAAAASQDVEAGAGDGARDLAGKGIGRVTFRRPGGAEERDSRLDVVEGREGAAQLRLDPPNPCFFVGGKPAQPFQGAPFTGVGAIRDHAGRAIVGPRR